MQINAEIWQLLSKNQGKNRQKLGKKQAFFIDKIGIHYKKRLVRKTISWEEIGEVGLYAERVKLKDRHYMNFSVTPNLTTAGQTPCTIQLWLWVSKGALKEKSPASFKRAFGGNDCLFLPVWKKQILPQFVKDDGAVAELIKQVATFAPQFEISLYA